MRTIDTRHLDKDTQLIPLLEQLLACMEDFAWGYDLDQEWSDRLEEFAEENDIPTSEADL